MPDDIAQFTLPIEAYTFTERARLMSDAATEGMEEYGLGGLAYAKTRKVATVASEARAWQDLNTPEVIPEGSTAIPDVDKRTRPKTADGKNYNEQARGRLAVEREHMAPLPSKRDPRKG